MTGGDVTGRSVRPGALGVALGLLALSPVARATGQVTPPQVLASFPAGTETYELALDACGLPPSDPDRRGCPFVVRLAGKPEERIELSQRSCGGDLSRGEVGRRLSADRRASAWTSSADRCEVQLAARTVELAPGVTGLLVTQLDGQEYQYREHRLLLVAVGKLRSIWKFEESTGGEDRSSTTVVAAKPGREAIAFIHVSRSSAGTATKVVAQRLHFDERKRRMVITGLPDARAPLQLIQLGRFETSAQAMDGCPRCLAQYEVLPARLFPRAKQKGFFLGRLLATEDLDAELAYLKGCREAPAPVVLEISPNGVRSHAGW